MSDQKTVSVNLGGSFTTLLAILFIGLKLTGHITWSWFWVLSPFWIPVALLVSIFLVIVLAMAGSAILSTTSNKRLRR